MRFFSTFRAGQVFLVGWLAVTTVASAIDYEWTNGDADNDFSNFANWEDGGASNPTDFLGGTGNRWYINLAGGDRAVINVDPHPSVSSSGRFRIGVGASDTGELEVSGGSTTIGDQFQVGQSGTAAFTLSGGLFEAIKSYATLGQSSGSDALMTVSGGTFHADRLTVSNAVGSDATLTITSGEILVMAGFDPTPSSTSGSLRMNSGNGEINISGTAVVTCESFITGNFDGGTAGTGILNMNGGSLNVTGSQIPSPDTLPTLHFADGGEVAFEGGTWKVFGDEVATIDAAIVAGKMHHSLGNTLIDASYDAMDDETTVNLRAPNHLEAWRITHHGSADNFGSSANDAAGVGGLRNLVAYGFGLDPAIHTVDDLPSPVVGLGTVTVSFNEPAGVSGLISYSLESSPDLEVWTPAPDTPGGGFDHVFIAPAVTPAMYYRVRVDEL